MAQRVSSKVIGVDVSKRTLEVFEFGTEQSLSIANERATIEQWLEQWEVPAQFIMEPTNQYHLMFAELAHERDHQVYLVDAYRLMHYRESVGERVKSDSCDARLLARYATHEQGQLRPWQPQSACEQRFWCLLKRRATLVRTRVQLKQSLRDLGELQADVDALLRQCTAVIRKLEQAMREEASTAGWDEHITRCQGLPGVGPLTAMALVATFHRGQFRNADAFIAFMGLDVRIRDSGMYRGKRKLTKKGDSELRRLLFNAAMQGRRNALWEPYYEALRSRGLSTTAAFVALSRKLGRVCFSLMRQQVSFNPEWVGKGCAAT